MNLKNTTSFDVLVVGAGAAGMTAAMYSSRANLKTGMIESVIYGGQMMNTSDVENFPSFPKITGAVLSQKMYDSCTSFGAETIFANVENVVDLGDIKEVHTSEGIYTAKAVIIATGSTHRELGIEGEREYQGMGVSYCAVCDGAFFKDKIVTVVGGGDSAIEEAIFLTQYAKEVRVVHRREELKAQKIIQERAFSNEKINFIWNAEVIEVKGKNKVSSVILKHTITDHTMELETDGLFIYIGLDPLTSEFRGLGVTDEDGWIVTDEDMKTVVNGIFSAGDVRKKNLRQITTAVGDGAIAGQKSYEYVSKLKSKS